MTSTNGAGELLLGATKTAPPAAVSALTLAGVSLSEWVLILTAVYTALQLGWFIYEKITHLRRRDG